MMILKLAMRREGIKVEDTEMIDDKPESSNIVFKYKAGVRLTREEQEQYALIQHLRYNNKLDKDHEFAIELEAHRVKKMASQKRMYRQQHIKRENSINKNRIKRQIQKASRRLNKRKK
jgi:hypothetical protein